MERNNLKIAVEKAYESRRDNIVIGLTGIIAEFVGSYQYLQIQQYLFLFASKQCILSLH